MAQKVNKKEDQIILGMVQKLCRSKDYKYQSELVKELSGYGERAVDIVYAYYECVLDDCIQSETATILHTGKDTLYATMEPIMWVIYSRVLEAVKRKKTLEK